MIELGSNSGHQRPHDDAVIPPPCALHRDEVICHLAVVALREADDGPTAETGHAVERDARVRVVEILAEPAVEAREWFLHAVGSLNALEVEEGRVHQDSDA